MRERRLAGHGILWPVYDASKKEEHDESFFCTSDARPRSKEAMEELEKTMIPLGELFRRMDESGSMLGAFRPIPQRLRYSDLLKNTAIMMAAAAVITRAVRASPSATAVALSPVRKYSSRIRDNKKTS